MNEADLIPISALEHVCYCPRQFALIHMEGVWAENAQTAHGRTLHENAHDPFFTEKRDGVITTRAVPLVSHRLGVTGQADVVVYHPSANGIQLQGEEGLWAPELVEYKRGKPTERHHDRVQLCAQAICLEEMLDVVIQKSWLFYWTIRSQVEVDLTDELRTLAHESVKIARQILSNGKLPPIQKTKKQCSGCSLIDLCLPSSKRQKPVASYINSALGGDEP